jgi:PAC2 family
MVFFEFPDQADLVEPVLLVAFEGWVSAGSAGTATAEFFAELGSIVGTLDADQLYDYRANRPTVDFVDGVMREIEWPALTLARSAAEGRDLLVLYGIEPNWNWRRLGDEVALFCERTGVSEVVSLGGVPWATPHTRPTSIIMTASDPRRLVIDLDRPTGQLRVPAAAANVVEAYMTQKGIPATGFWARVPHYIGATYYPAVAALVERVCVHLGIAVEHDGLLELANEQVQQLDAILEVREEAKAMVEQLESLVDGNEGGTGEELASEIERFLREQTGGAGSGFGDDA